MKPGAIQGSQKCEFCMALFYATGTVQIEYVFAFKIYRIICIDKEIQTFVNKSNITGLISYRGWDTNIETVTVKAVMGAI
jgi:hypothetical protein